jgi:hypothetical protein
MKSALQYHGNQINLSEEDTYATAEYFQRLFASEMPDLFRLSLRLTADAEKAERGLILALRECITSSTVSKRWAIIWARRTVVRNAIRLVLGIETAIPHRDSVEAGPDSQPQPQKYRIEAMGDSLPILSLPDFDRLVFVICVLERYSDMDCALLLTSSPKEVNDARMRAINMVVSAEDRNRRDATAVSPYVVSSNQLGGLDDSCGSLFD